MTENTFKSKNTTKKLLAVLKERSRDILSQRYGLLPQDAHRKTLEAIGKSYGITRERVRQIENFSLQSIRKSDAYQEVESVLEQLQNEVQERGSLVNENYFLSALAKDDSAKNHIYFLMVLSPQFTKLKEDDSFEHRWSVDMELANKIHIALSNLHNEINEDNVVSEKDILSYFAKHAQKEGLGDKGNEKILRDWLLLSKIIDKNPLGEWGLASSSNIRPRGVRDLAFLILKKHGSPMHFTEVANDITKVFSKKAHPQTTHNELIKDDRFVLVGRGLYGLSDWGYSTGTIRDVIKDILTDSKPLSKEEIVKKVLKERYVKNNTIVVNLQDKKYFKKDTAGRYAIV